MQAPRRSRSGVAIWVAGGVYVDAQRAPFRSAGRPRIDISDGRGCNTRSGLFEVKDIAVGAGGAITRLWIVYAQYCEGGTRALWGEVKIGVPATGSLLSAPATVRWPAGDVSRPGTAVPVTFVAQAPPTVGSASISGTGAADYANGSFELDLSGWAPTQATVTRVVGGAHGT